MIGEIGGSEEERAAGDSSSSEMSKPVDRLHRGGDGAGGAKDGPRRRDRHLARSAPQAQDGGASRPQAWIIAAKNPTEAAPDDGSRWSERLS